MFFFSTSQSFVLARWPSPQLAPLGFVILVPFGVKVHSPLKCPPPHFTLGFSAAICSCVMKIWHRQHCVTALLVVYHAHLTFVWRTNLWPLFSVLSIVPSWLSIYTEALQCWPFLWPFWALTFLFCSKTRKYLAHLIQRLYVWYFMLSPFAASMISSYTSWLYMQRCVSVLVCLRF